MGVDRLRQSVEVAGGKFASQSFIVDRALHSERLKFLNQPTLGWRTFTAGNFDTNVIANEMYDKAFTEFNFGVGSALAVVLFLSILPIMYYNIRRMQKAAV